MFCLCLTTGPIFWFYGEITEFAKQTVVRKLLLGQCCDGLLAIVAVSCTAVSDLSYIVESVASWEKESGSVAKLRASNVRFGYYTILMEICRRSAGAMEARWRRAASASIYNWECLFVCLFAKTMARIDTKRAGITKNDSESVLRRLKSTVLVFLGKYRDISVFSFAAYRHFYLSPFHFWLLPRCLTQRLLKNGVDRAQHRYW